jgi:hypothetical protein
MSDGCDHTTETMVQLHLEYYLDDPRLVLNEVSLPWILNHIDRFVSESRGNKVVEDVVLYPYSVNGHNYEALIGHNYEVLNKVGQAIGNLQALKTLCIASENYHVVGYSSDEEDDEGDSSDEEDDEGDLSGEEDDEGDSSGEDNDEVVPPAPTLDFEILARILSHVRQGITIDITNALAWDAEESRSFVRAIYGHPTITGFEAGRNFPYKSLDALYAALATLPALQSIRLRKRQIRTEDESTLAHPESLTELLRVPSLRSVGFDFFDFTPALSQATANALMEGTVITRLEFIRCSFCTQEGVATMANALTRNRSVTYIEVESLFFGTLNDALTAALPLNTTWRDLVLSGKIIDDDADFSPVVLALGKNTALKTLTIGAFGSMDESLCTAMQDGLEINETLSSLELNHCLCGENPELWCRALSFLRTNTALKSLTIAFNMDSTKSCVDTLCGQIATMLQENSSLESLNIQKSKAIMIKAESIYFSSPRSSTIRRSKPSMLEAMMQVLR